MPARQNKEIIRLTRLGITQSDPPPATCNIAKKNSGHHCRVLLILFYCHYTGRFWLDWCEAN